MGSFLGASIHFPDGQIVQREMEDHGAAVPVLACNPQRKIAMLVQQFRAPPFFSLGQKHTPKAIADVMEDADSIPAARREALEEAGIRLRSFERVATVWSMLGISIERMTLYLAAYQSEDHITEGGEL